MLLSALGIANCAPNIDPARNGINLVLNEGGAVVTGSIHSNDAAQVSALAQKYPVCVAYQLPPNGPRVNDTLRGVMRTISRSGAVGGRDGIDLNIYQAQRPRGSLNPIPEIIAIGEALPVNERDFVHFAPVPSTQFRSRATCREKETILIVGDKTYFYQAELPMATLDTGELPIDTILFLEWTSRKVNF